MNSSCISSSGCNQDRCSGITPGTQRFLGRVKWYDAVKVALCIVLNSRGMVSSHQVMAKTYLYLINIYTKKEDKRRPVLIAGETVEYSVVKASKGFDAREVSLPDGQPFPS